jgi:hypothetical protein
MQIIDAKELVPKDYEMSEDQPEFAPLKPSEMNVIF